MPQSQTLPAPDPIPLLGPLSRRAQTPAVLAWRERCRQLHGADLVAHLAEVWRHAGSFQPLFPLGRILRSRIRHVEEQAAAAHALGALGHPVGLHLCLGLLGDVALHPDVRVAAALALGRGGRIGVTALERALVDPLAPVRVAAARALLGALPHAQALQVLHADGPHSGDARRLAAIAAFAAGDAGALAELALDGRGGPERPAWALLALRQRARQDTIEAVLGLLDPTTDPRLVLVEGPLLAMAEPAMVAEALPTDFDPESPVAGRMLHLAGLLGAPALPILTRWSQRAQPLREIDELLGLAGGTESLAATLTGTLLRADGALDLLVRLKDPHLPAADRRAAIYPLLHHRLRWHDATVDRDLISAVRSALASTAPDLQSRAVWMCGELRLGACAADVAAHFPRHPFAAWSLSEMDTPRADQLLGELAAKPDAAIAARQLLYALVQRRQTGPADLLARCHALTREPCWWRYALMIGSDQVDDLAHAPPGERLAWQLWQGEATDLDALPMTLLREAAEALETTGRGDALLPLLPALHRADPDAAIERLARCAPSFTAAAADQLDRLVSADLPNDLRLLLTGARSGLGSAEPPLPLTVSDVLNAQERANLLFAHRQLTTASDDVRGIGLIGLGRTLEHLCRRALPAPLGRILTLPGITEDWKRAANDHALTYAILHAVDAIAPGTGSFVSHAVPTVVGALGKGLATARPDGLAFWAAAVALVGCGPRLGRFRPKVHVPTLLTALSRLQSARNPQAHGIQPLARDRGDAAWEDALAAIGQVRAMV